MPDHLIIERPHPLACRLGSPNNGAIAALGWEPVNIKQLSAARLPVFDQRNRYSSFASVVFPQLALEFCG
jgi:hypothetical protein